MATQSAVPIMFGETALQKLFALYLSKCSEVWDPRKVFVGPIEWAKNITDGVARIIVEQEEDTMTFKIGTKVRRVDGITGLATQNGVVVANCALVSEVETFEDLEDRNHSDIENQKRLGQMVQVAWHYTDGKLICEAWHTPEQLESL
jgi:hypothetical protein